MINIKKIKYLIVLIIFSVYFALHFKKNTKISPFKIYENLISNSYRLGFKDLDNEVLIEDLPIIGSIPKWLSGTLYRNGPAKFTTANSWVSNWFDGLAMIHAFTINDGRISYSNKFLKTTDYENAITTGNMSYMGFVQDPCKSVFKSLLSLFVPNLDKNKLNNTNVNIALYTNHLIALTETPLPVEFDFQSLKTIGVLNYQDDLPKINIHDTAHPHYDPENKEHVGYFTKFGRQNSHNIFKIKDGTTTREVIGTYAVDKPSYMHSFAITKNFAILTALPLVVLHPFKLLLKNRGFIKNFHWKPERGTKFIVFDRINHKLIDAFSSEPFFAFHNVNAFEQGNKIILDIITYPDSSIIDESYFETILAPQSPKYSNNEFNGYGGILKRYMIDLETSNVVASTVINEQIELPRINYEKYNTKDYTFIYAYAGFKYPFTADKLLKINVKTKEIKSWQQTHCYTGEPVFISQPNSNDEDSGVVLSVVLDVMKQKSFLLVLDAQKFSEIGRAELPHHIPFGIHGKFIQKII